MTTLVKAKNKRRAQHVFHPSELALCGYSNSGKTTLITRLLERFRDRYSMGYVKHDAHSFQMDVAGKDTARARQCGADRVMISDSSHWALVGSGEMGMYDQKRMMWSADFVFVEGYKNLGIDKIIVIDSDKKIIEPILNGDVTNIIAYVGATERAINLPTAAPYFHRDDIVGLSYFIEEYFKTKLIAAPLHGLVLTGGKSERMGQDKALLPYGNKPQALWAYEMLKSYCDEVFLSSRPGQWEGSALAHYPQIHDQLEGFGPMAGILSAQRVYPEAAWLVVACDLPHLDEDTIEKLIQNRDVFKIATCYKSSENSLPEPLCTIYEPKSYFRLMESIGQGIECPRKVLLHSPAKQIDLSAKEALANINYFQEYEMAVINFQKERSL